MPAYECLMNRASESGSVGHRSYMCIHRQFVEAWLKSGLSKIRSMLLHYCLDIEILDELEEVVRLDSTRSAINSKFKPVEYIFRVRHIAPVAQWIK